MCLLVGTLPSPAQFTIKGTSTSDHTQRSSSKPMIHFNSQQLAGIPVSDPFNLVLQIDTAIYELQLEPTSIFTDDLRITTSNGGEISIPKHSIYIGQIQNKLNSYAQLSLWNGQLTAMIKDGSNTTLIEPGKAVGTHYIYDHVQMEEHICASNHEESDRRTSRHTTQSRTFRPQSMPTCETIELAIAIESSLISHHGSAAAAIIQLANVMQAVQPNYENDAFHVRFKISHIYISNSPATDWDTNTDIDAGLLLDDFEAWGNNGGFGDTDYDLASLWTKRDLSAIIDGVPNSAVIGKANNFAVCRTNRYNVLEAFTNNINQLRVLAAHEIGHNLDADHDDANNPSIMQSTLNASATTFSSISQGEISLYLSYFIARCVTACNDADCEVILDVNATNGDHIASSVITTSSSLSLNGNMTLDAPEVMLFTDFTVPIARQLSVFVEGCD